MELPDTFQHGELEKLTDDFIPTREDVENLQKIVSQLPQTESLETDHYFSGGMYCRKLFRKQHTLIVGKVHKADHIFLCAMGEIKVWTEKGIKILKAGDVLESKAGTKRVTLALTDAIGITIHKTDKTDLDEIEKELIEEDGIALFDSNNKLKQVLISDNALEIGELI